MRGGEMVIVITMALGAGPARALAQAKPSSVSPPGVRPLSATGRCSDGTFWTSFLRLGACGGHGGVAEWFRLDPPKDATARCGDATWTASNDREAACLQHGGVRLWLPPRRPPNATARCGDGSWWTNPEVQNACAGRGGVSDWYGGPGGPLPEKASSPLRLRIL
jgi:hypothetical protein